MLYGWIMTVVTVCSQASDDAGHLTDNSKYIEELALLKRNLDRYWQEVDATNDN